MTAITNRLRQIIYKHRTQDSCQSKYPAKESQQKNHTYHSTQKTACMLKKQLPIIIYIGLPHTFKSFGVKVKDRSSYSINVQIYRCSPNPYSWTSEPKD